MYGSDQSMDELERTAFRIAEKKYKLYYDANARASKKKKVPRELDLSDVLDFKSVLERHDRTGEVPDRWWLLGFLLGESSSLGCKTIFLLGGKSREDPPLAMFLRSRDIVLTAGEARECFHGVLRVFTDEQS